MKLVHLNSEFFQLNSFLLQTLNWDLKYSLIQQGTFTSFGKKCNVYKAKLCKYFKWRVDINCDSYSGSVYDVAYFLATLYREGLTYFTICCYRSAVSSIHDLVDEKNAGEHPQEVRLLKGIFNLKHPLKQPWYINQYILYCFRKATFESLMDVPFKYLTFKTAFPVAILRI